MKQNRVYVDVNVDFTGEGDMRPRSIVWEDGTRYEIDRVKDVRAEHAARAGGTGDRYTVMVKGQERYLYFEHSTDEFAARTGRWFLERREESYNG